MEAEQPLLSTTQRPYPVSFITRQISHYSALRFVLEFCILNIFSWPVRRRIAFTVTLLTPFVAHYKKSVIIIFVPPSTTFQQPLSEDQVKPRIYV